MKIKMTTGQLEQQYKITRACVLSNLRDVSNYRTQNNCQQLKSFLALISSERSFLRHSAFVRCPPFPARTHKNPEIPARSQVSVYIFLFRSWRVLNSYKVVAKTFLRRFVPRCSTYPLAPSRKEEGHSLSSDGRSSRNLIPIPGRQILYRSTLHSSTLRLQRGPAQRSVHETKQGLLIWDGEIFHQLPNSTFLTMFHQNMKSSETQFPDHTCSTMC